jgi:hypothetical protein
MIPKPKPIPIALSITCLIFDGPLFPKPFHRRCTFTKIWNVWIHVKKLKPYSDKERENNDVTERVKLCPSERLMNARQEVHFRARFLRDFLSP